MREGSDPNTAPVDEASVRAGQVVQHEKAALEDHLGMVSRDFRVAQNDIVSRIAPDREGTMGLQPIALFSAVEADE